MFPNQHRSHDNAPVIKRESDENRPKINDEIKAYKVRVIDHTETNIGIISIRDAILKSREVGLDLVEVSPQANPPVCKIMDFRKYIFEQKKKAKENTHKSPETHELRLSIGIGQNDLEIKARKAQEFLAEGSKVILSFKVKGREAAKVELIRGVVQRFYELVKEQSTLESKGGVHLLTPR